MTPTDKPTQVGGLLPEPVAYANKLQLLGVLSADSAILGRNVLMSRSKTIKRTEPMFSADQMKANVQALEARLVALEKDAARYQWLRNNPDALIRTDEFEWYIDPAFTYNVPESLDKEIDAALLESKPRE